MNMLFPENSYMGNCSCGTDFIAPKGTLHCHNCLYKHIAELEGLINSQIFPSMGDGFSGDYVNGYEKALSDMSKALKEGEQCS